MSRETRFDPKSVNVSQLAYRLRMCLSGAYALLADLIELKTVKQITRGRYAFVPQNMLAKIRRTE